MDSKDNGKDEKTLWLIGKIFFALVMLLFILHGFIIPPKDAFNPLENDRLWSAMHPASFLNIIGFILTIASFAMATGILRKIVGERILPVGSAWPNYAMFVGGILGVLLMYS